MSQRADSSGEELPVVELGLVAEDMGVGVGGDGEVALPDPLADPRPGDTAQMKQADPAMPQVMWAPERYAFRLARVRDRRP